jgi:hypothetical protein
MKPERKRSKIVKTTMYHQEYKIYSNYKFTEPYWDEGRDPRRTARRGFVGYHKRKCIYKYQQRMYLTWKHNRKTQWK